MSRGGVREEDEGDRDRATSKLRVKDMGYCMANEKNQSNEFKNISEWINYW